ATLYNFPSRNCKLPSKKRRLVAPMSWRTSTRTKGSGGAFGRGALHRACQFVSQETVAMMSDYGVYFDPTFISLVQHIETASETPLLEAIVSNPERTVSKGWQVYEWAKQ